MSYILDALKKIDHEKNKKTLPGGRVSISGDLFQERKQPPARARIWKTMALIAAASLVTCAGTWFALQGNSKKSAVAIRPTASPPAPVIPQIAPAPVPAPIQSQPAPAAAPSAASTAPVPVTEAGGDADTSTREVRALRTKKGIKAQPPSTFPKLPAQTVQPPADIKLSGIAWQEERTARRAVINGFLLKEGAVISGAKIMDIQADKVRFSSATGSFELKLDAVLPAEVKK